MDVKLHLSVLWRFKWLVAAGFVLAIVVTVMAVATVSFKGGPHLAYRGTEVWSSTETVLVTQSGFPIGQSIYNQVVPVTTGDGPVTGQSGTYVPRYANDGRFASLAALYARLANSDPVEHLIFTRQPVKGGVSLTASAVSDTQVGPLPLIQVIGMGTSRSAAIAMAHSGATALRDYIEAQQTANHVPDDSRVLLATVKRAGSVSPIDGSLGGATLVQGHSKLKPLFIFAAVFGLFVAIAYVLENLRPRIRLVQDGPQRRPVQRRSAA